jgi:hypothetical protein
MSKTIAPDTAAALANAQGVPFTPQSAADAAKFSALVLGNSASAFSTLAFEDEPSGYTAQMRRHAP